jgi:hypothetical protein
MLTGDTLANGFHGDIIVTCDTTISSFHLQAMVDYESCVYSKRRTIGFLKQIGGATQIQIPEEHCRT